MLEQLTPLILTFNEEANIDRTLAQLTWADRIVVVDSFSNDRTLEILRTFPQVEVFQNQFNSFAAQCNFGLEKINSEWVLSLDADYYLSNELVKEIQVLTDVHEINGYWARFKYCVFGKPLRGTLLPPRQVLYRCNQSTYKQDGHAHRVHIEGKSACLNGYIHHDDRKDLSRWLWAQDRYMVIEAQKILHTPDRELSFADRLRKQKVIAPLIILFYCLILKGGIWDGWAGCYYAWQRTLAEILLAIHLIEAEKLENTDS